MNPHAVERRVNSLNRVMQAHRGGVQLVASEEGRVVLSFDGMCTGCTYRPVCAETLVRPAFDDLPELTEVDIVGTRVNDENRRNLARGLSGHS